MTRTFRPGIPLAADGMTPLGSDPSLGPEHRLAHPLIARRHAEVTLGRGKATLRDLGFGTFVNSSRVTGREVPLTPGDQIDIGPFAYVFTGSALESVAAGSTVQLTARGLSHTVRVGGQDRHILDGIDLVIEPGEFVCLLGPSGCGKSTLLTALAGRSRPSGGQVFLNHRNLHEQFDLLKDRIAFVPQKPILHADLSVNEALWWTARLRLPASADRAAQVGTLLERMQMREHAGKRVRRLSGGQEKRACLANELLSDPAVVFLDEVTSGLDENIDGELMGFFAELAKEGKTVVCVTHCLAHVDRCQLVVILAPGGKLAYVGPPQLAPQYFNVPSLGEVYALLTPERADEWARKFEKSSEYQTFVVARMPDSPTTTSGPGRAKSSPMREGVTLVYQSALLTLRQGLLLARDLGALRGLLGQVVFVALILGFAFGKIEAFPPETKVEKADRIRKERLDEKERTQSLSDKERKEWEEYNRVEASNVPRSSVKRHDWVRKVLNLLFLLAIVSFWLGCNNAAREVVKERSITSQERHFNLRVGAYYFSKLLVLTLIGWAQVLLLLFAVWLWCEPPLDAPKPDDSAAAKRDDSEPKEPTSVGVKLWSASKLIPLMLSLSFAGTALGLLLSATASSESVAVTLIPIAVIPQIILSGAIVKLPQWIEPPVQVAITTYWGRLGMDALLVGEAGEFARKGDVKLIESIGTLWPLTYILVQAVVFIAVGLAGLAADGSLRGAMGKLRSSVSLAVRR